MSYFNMNFTRYIKKAWVSRVQHNRVLISGFSIWTTSTSKSRLLFQGHATPFKSAYERVSKCHRYNNNRRRQNESLLWPILFSYQRQGPTRLLILHYSVQVKNYKKNIFSKLYSTWLNMLCFFFCSPPTYGVFSIQVWETIVSRAFYSWPIY